MALSQPQIVTHRTEDYPGLDQASGGELERLLRALNTNTQGAQQALTSLQANPLLAASYYRLNEGPYPTSSSAICLLLQYRTGSSWATVSAWGKDGRPINEAWIAPTMANAWVAGGGGGYAAPGYFKDATGIVRYRGSVKSGTLATTALTVPAGYRSAFTLLFAVYSSAGTLAFVSIDSGGNVVPVVGNTAGIYLDGISYRAEQ